jgi:hypothetical protein
VPTILRGADCGIHLLQAKAVGTGESPATTASGFNRKFQFTYESGPACGEPCKLSPTCFLVIATCILSVSAHRSSADLLLTLSCNRFYIYKNHTFTSNLFVFSQLQK